MVNPQRPDDSIEAQDTEGHLARTADTSNFARGLDADEDDTEGHLTRTADTSDFARGLDADDEDTEGHFARG